VGSVVFDEAESAGLPGIHDVTVPEVPCIDREGRAVFRPSKIDAAGRQSFHPAQERAGKKHVATGSGPMAFPHAASEARLDVLGPKVNEIESPHFAPNKDGAIPPAKGPQSMHAPLLVDTRAFI